MSRDPHKEDKKQPPRQQAATGHSAWELNRLSPTGRNFLLEPDSRTSIVQELQMRLRREQQRREQMLLLSSLNNTAQDQSGTSVQEAGAGIPLPRQQLGDEEQEIPAAPTARVTTSASLDSYARPEPVVTQRNSAIRNSTKKSSSLALGFESEPVTNQQAMATDGAAEVDTDSPQRKSFKPPISSANDDTAEQELAMPAGSSSSLTAGKGQEPPTAYLNESPTEQSPTSTRAVSNFTGEKINATDSRPTLRSMQQTAGSSPGEELSPSGPPSSSIRRNSVRSETSSSRQRNDEESNPDPSDISTSMVGRSELDSTDNGSLLPMRRNSARSTHSTVVAVPATESASSVPIASPRRNSVRSETQTSAEAPKAAGGNVMSFLSATRDSVRSETETTAEPPKAAGENVMSFLSATRDSVRSATTQTPADSQSGERRPSQQQSQPLRTPPCLQCLMRCLQDSGLLGSCWKAAVFELEEAFAIREVADAAIGKSVAGAGGESMEQRLPTQNRQSASGENSTVESPPQAEVNKWQALERLCHLRNSLRTCSHPSDA